MPTTAIPLVRIHPDPHNVRDTLSDADIGDLAASIRRVGLLQAPVVYQVADGEMAGVPGGDYVVSAGHRRIRALLQLAAAGDEYSSVECTVVPRPAGELERLDLMGAENLNRRSLNLIEEAKLYHQYHLAQLTQPMIAVRLSVQQSRVSHCLALLMLPEDTQRRIAAGDMSMGQAIAAVRAYRKQAGTLRSDTGTRHAAPSTNSAGVRVPYFDETHPLARRAQQRCLSAGGAERHPNRFGGACGDCWEHVIRADEAGRSSRRSGVPRPGPAGPAPTVKRCTLCGAQGLALEGTCTSVIDGKRVIRSGHNVPFVPSPR